MDIGSKYSSETCQKGPLPLACTRGYTSKPMLTSRSLGPYSRTCTSYAFQSPHPVSSHLPLYPKHPGCCGSQGSLPLATCVPYTWFFHAHFSSPDHGCLLLFLSILDHTNASGCFLSLIYNKNLLAIHRVAISVISLLCPLLHQVLRPGGLSKDTEKLTKLTDAWVGGRILLQM